MKCMSRSHTFCCSSESMSDCVYLNRELTSTAGGPSTTRHRSTKSEGIRVSLEAQAGLPAILGSE